MKQSGSKRISVNVPVTPEIAESMKSAAKAMNRSVADYLRQLHREHLKESPSPLAGPAEGV